MPATKAATLTIDDPLHIIFLKRADLVKKRNLFILKRMHSAHNAKGGRLSDKSRDFDVRSSEEIGGKENGRIETDRTGQHEGRRSQV